MSGYQHLVSGAVLGADLITASKHVQSGGLSRLPFLSDLIVKISTFFMPGGVVMGMVCFFLFFLGCLFPDVDSPNSLLGKRVHISMGGHRFWMHTIYPVMLCAVFASRSVILAWFALGYFLHLFMDNFSKCGVCFFNPVSGYRVYPGGAKVKKNHYVVLYWNEVSAWIVCMILAMASAVFLWQSRVLWFPEI